MIYVKFFHKGNGVAKKINFSQANQVIKLWNISQKDSERNVCFHIETNLHDETLKHFYLFHEGIG